MIQEQTRCTTQRFDAITLLETLDTAGSSYLAH
jgi:hypothetical protein